MSDISPCLDAYLERFVGAWFFPHRACWLLHPWEAVPGSIHGNRRFGGLKWCTAPLADETDAIAAQLALLATRLRRKTAAQARNQHKDDEGAKITCPVAESVSARGKIHTHAPSKEKSRQRQGKVVARGHSIAQQRPTADLHGTEHIKPNRVSDRDHARQTLPPRRD